MYNHSELFKFLIERHKTRLMALVHMQHSKFDTGYDVVYSSARLLINHHAVVQGLEFKEGHSESYFKSDQFQKESDLTIFTNNERRMCVEIYIKYGTKRWQKCAMSTQPLICLSKVL